MRLSGVGSCVVASLSQSSSESVKTLPLTTNTDRGGDTPICKPKRVLGARWRVAVKFASVHERDARNDGGDVNDKDSVARSVVDGPPSDANLKSEDAFTTHAAAND